MGEMLSLTSLLGGAPVAPDALLGLTPVETPGAVDPFAELLATMVEASGAAAMPLPKAIAAQPARIAAPPAPLPDPLLPTDAAPAATDTATTPATDNADLDDDADAAVAAILATFLPLAPPRAAAVPVEEHPARSGARPAMREPLTASAPLPLHQSAHPMPEDGAATPLATEPALAAAGPAAPFAAIQALMAKPPEPGKQPAPTVATDEPADSEAAPAPAVSPSQAPVATAQASTATHISPEVRPASREVHERPAPERPAERDPIARDVADIALPGFTAPVEGREPAASVSAPADVAGTGTVQRHLAVAQDGLWLDQLARDITRSAGNGSDLHFKLDPVHLGSLTVQIAQLADGASIKITTDTEHARTIIHDAQPRLVAEARAQGLKVSETQVDLSQRDGGGSPWGGSASGWSQAGQQSGQRQSQQGQAPLPVHQPSSGNPGIEEPARPLAAASERYA